MSVLRRGDLHQYQEYGVKFLLDHPHSALLLSCGLGKTVITLTAINDLLFDSFESRKVLVICPLRVAAVWAEEISKWEHLRGLCFSVAVGTEAERTAALRQTADIYIINRENIQWLLERSRVPLGFDMVIVDESSSFKNHQTKRFKALMKLRPQVKRVVLLSATPAANNLIDLWAQFRLLDLGQRLGRFIGWYRNAFFTPDKRNAQVIFSYKPLPNAEEQIYARISDIAISMKSTDHLQMPKLVSAECPVWLSDPERARYEALKRDLILALSNGEVSAANAAALSNKLLQLANGAVYGDVGEVFCIHDRKLDALEDLIEAANGKPVLIAYWFKHDLTRILERFPAEKLDGADSIKRWNNGEIPIAVIHPASAGHGLNLQSGGSALVWFSLTWSLELYLQTNARIYRQGQKDTVVIHHIIAKGTIDEQVMAVLKRKDKTQNALIEAVKANLQGGVV